MTGVPAHLGGWEGKEHIVPFYPGSKRRCLQRGLPARPAAPQAGLVFPWGKSPPLPLLTSPLFGSGPPPPPSAQRPLPGVMPSVSPSRVCPPSLAWCLQLWSPPPTPGQHHPARVSSPRAPSPALGNGGGSTGLSHPESQDALPSSGPAQLLPLPQPTAHPAPPGKTSWGRGPAPLPPRPPVLGSVLSLAMWRRREGGCLDTGPFVPA